jgi:hypothetical protein
MFWPEQPKPLNTCSMAIGPLGLMSGLVSLNAARGALLRGFRGMACSGERSERDCSPYNAAEPAWSLMLILERIVSALLVLIGNAFAVPLGLTLDLHPI